MIELFTLETINIDNYDIIVRKSALVYSAFGIFEEGGRWSTIHLPTGIRMSNKGLSTSEAAADMVGRLLKARTDWYIDINTLPDAEKDFIGKILFSANSKSHSITFNSPDIKSTSLNGEQV